MVWSISFTLDRNRNYLTSKRLIWVLSYSNLVSTSRILASCRHTRDFSTMDCSWNWSWVWSEWSWRVDTHISSSETHKQGKIAPWGAAHLLFHLCFSICSSVTTQKLGSTDVCTLKLNYSFLFHYVCANWIQWGLWRLCIHRDQRASDLSRIH